MGHTLTLLGPAAARRAVCQVVPSGFSSCHVTRVSLPPQACRHSKPLALRSLCAHLRCRMRHALLQLLCVLLTAWLPSGQEVGLALQVGESVTHDALAGAAAAATLGGRVFIATRTGTVSVLQVLLPSSLVVLGSLQDASFASASALAVAEDPENSGAARLFLTLTTGSLLSLHCAADGQLSLLGGVDAPAMLAGANSLALRGAWG